MATFLPIVLALFRMMGTAPKETSSAYKKIAILTIVRGSTIWRVSNSAVCSWRPSIDELLLYSDTSCSTAVAIPTDGGWPDAATSCSGTGCDLCSGWHTASTSK